MSGAPSPMQLPGQSWALAGNSPLLTNRYEKRRSLTRFGRSEVVKAPRIWSDQEGVLVQLDGTAAEPADAAAVVAVSDGAKARIPSCDRRTNALLFWLARTSRRTLPCVSWEGLGAIWLKPAKSCVRGCTLTTLRCSVRSRLPKKKSRSRRTGPPTANPNCFR